MNIPTYNISLKYVKKNTKYGNIKKILLILNMPEKNYIL